MPVTTMKNAIRFEVEWCREIPKDENGDSNFDRAVYVVEHFNGFVDAVARAKVLLRERLDAFGCVVVSEQRKELEEVVSRRLGRPYFTWEYTRSIHINDPDEPVSESDMLSRSSL